MNEPCILFRKMNDNIEERKVCNEYFNTYNYREDIDDNSLVIGRYSVIPYYNELEYGLKTKGCRLINSKYEHDWIANFDWYFGEYGLSDITPKSYKELYLPYIVDGHYVVKGCTNSKKFSWKHDMYAYNKEKLYKIISNLKNDFYIGEQDIIIREYIPLKTFEWGINELPITNEWRFFYYKSNLLSYGYYWSILDNLSLPYITDKAIDFANDVSKIVSKYVSFFVLDIAETNDGEWILIEINDGQMSGLSENDPNVLYGNLKKYINKELNNEFEITSN